ncbi:MAG: response regulator transcription factor [Saprospiraceae bacterium]|nr:response regulator transcription factor [Saprospiraceae bacterium]
MKILIVEDEIPVAESMIRGLTEAGYQVTHEPDGLMGLQKAYEATFDLIILDVILPRMNGIEISKKLHQMDGFETPVLFLTALGSADDIVEGLDTGADDYLVKPFNFKELLARIRALTRRKSANVGGNMLRLADLMMDLDAKKVIRAGEELKLTAREFSLLEFLMKNKNRVISRNDILEKVWDMNFDPGTNVVDVYVNYLRNKVDKKFDKRLIHTIVGMGYVMRED